MTFIILTENFIKYWALISNTKRHLARLGKTLTYTEYMHPPSSIIGDTFIYTKTHTD